MLSTTLAGSPSMDTTILPTLDPALAGDRAHQCPAKLS